MAEQVRFIITVDDNGSPSIKRFGATLRTVEGSAQRLTGGLSRAQAAIITLNQGFALLDRAASGTVRVFQALVSDAERLTRLSRAFNLPARELGGLDLVAQQAGASLEGLARGMTRLAANVVTGLTDKTSTAARALRVLGADAKALDGAQGDLIATFQVVGKGLLAVESSTLRAALAQRLFGLQWQESMAVLGETDGNLVEAIAHVERLGGIMNDDLRRALTDVGLAFKDVQFAVKGFVLALVGEVNLDAVAARFRRLAEEIADFTRSAKFDALLTDIHRLIDGLSVLAGIGKIVIGFELRGAEVALKLLHGLRQEISGNLAAQESDALQSGPLADRLLRAGRITSIERTAVTQGDLSAVIREQQKLRHETGATVEALQGIAPAAEAGAAGVNDINAALDTLSGAGEAAAQKLITQQTDFRLELSRTLEDLRAGGDAIDQQFRDIIRQGQDLHLPREETERLGAAFVAAAREAAQMEESIKQATERDRGLADLRQEVAFLEAGFSDAQIRIEETVEKLTELGASEAEVRQLATRLEDLRTASENAGKGIVDVFDVLERGSSDVFEALILGTRDVADAFEGLKLSIIRSFIEAFAEGLKAKLGFEGSLKINLVGLVQQIGGIFTQGLPGGIGGLISGESGGAAGAFGGGGGGLGQVLGIGRQVAGTAGRPLLNGLFGGGGLTSGFTPVLSTSGETLALITPSGQFIGAGAGGLGGAFGTVGTAGTGLTAGFTPVINAAGETVALFTPAGNLVTSSGISAVGSGAPGAAGGLASVLGPLAVIGSLFSLFQTGKSFAGTFQQQDDVTFGQSGPRNRLRATGAGLVGGLAGGGAAAGAIIGAGTVVGAPIGAIVGAALGAAIGQAINQAITGAIGSGVSKAVSKGLSQSDLQQTVLKDPTIQALLYTTLAGQKKLANVLLKLFIPDIEEIFDDLFVDFVEQMEVTGVKLNDSMEGFLGEGLDKQARGRLQALFFGSQNASDLQADVRGTIELVATLIGAGSDNIERQHRFFRIFANSMAEAGQ